MKIPAYLKLIITIFISELAGIVGSLFTTPSITTWYATITRPTFAPPNWIFAPVWTTLFVLMGIAAFLVWQKGLDSRPVRVALWIFFGQLLLNTLWSVIFFGLHSPGGALTEIAFLWLAIVATIKAFYRVSKPAAYLLLPYLAWVTFAAYLNYTIWMLN